MIEYLDLTCSDDLVYCDFIMVDKTEDERRMGRVSNVKLERGVEGLHSQLITVLSAVSKEQQNAENNLTSGPCGLSSHLCPDHLGETR